MGSNTHVCSFQEDRWENINFSSKPRHVTPQIDHLEKNKSCSEGFNIYVWGYQGDRWENVHFESKARLETPKINDQSWKNKPCSEGFNTHLWRLPRT